jgi:methylmalonyl-CoA mutase C-terminal domain/subunit
MPERKIRVMVAKPGLDGHDRGARVLARCFRDAGFEVVYTGCHQTPEQIAAAAIQELLREKDAQDITVIGGGIIPEQDFPALYSSGIKAIFTPGASLDSIVDWIRTNVKPH